MTRSWAARWRERRASRRRADGGQQAGGPGIPITDPTAIIREGPADPGTYAQFAVPAHPTRRCVVRTVREAEVMVRGWGGGLAVVDGREVGLSDGVGRAALDVLVAEPRQAAERRIRIVLGDGTSLHFPTE